MFYPTVTERQVRMEPVGHDPFIDSLPAPASRPAAAAPRPRRPHARRRLRGERLDGRRLSVRLR